jgi:predicted ATPase
LSPKNSDSLIGGHRPVGVSRAKPTACTHATATTYTAIAAMFDSPAEENPEQRIELAEIEIDNLRAAFEWSREHSDIALGLTLVSSLQPLWLSRGRMQEGSETAPASARWRPRCVRGPWPRGPYSP